MKFRSILLLLLLHASLLSAQKNFNQSFEKFEPASGKPLDWSLGTGGAWTDGGTFTIDSSTTVDGRYSLRLESAKGIQFIPFSLFFPADFEGKTITLSGSIKTENVSENGWAGLWLRLDTETGVAGFDNMQSRALKGNNDWQEYSITLEYTEETRKIYIGGLVVGGGTAWFDNLKVMVDDKALLEAPARIIKKAPAELDTTFNASSKVALGALTPQRIEDLVLLGKVWGFLKYHHPKIAAGELNWDYELFRFLARYPEGLKAAKRDQLLADWIKSLGDLPDCPACDEKIEGKVYLTADLSWINDAKLGADLHKQLNAVYKHRNQGKNYYIGHVPGIGNPDFQHESAYPQFKYPDEGFRLLSLYRFWNMIQYFFPYRDIIGEDWTGVMRTFVPKIIQAPDALSYKLCVRELIGRIHDTHANLWIQDEELSAYFGKLRPAVQVKFIENQAVVTDYYHDELGPKSGLLPGDIISQIDGVPVAEIVQKKLPLYPASNVPTKMRDIAKDLLRSNKTSLPLRIQRDNSTMDVVVDCYDAKTAQLKLGRDWAYKQPDSCYRLLTPDIGFLFLGNVKEAVLPAMMEQFKNTKGLIVDIRNYPSEFVVFSLGALLKSESSNFVYFTNGHVENPGLFTHTDFIANGEANAEPYKGKVVVLVNEITQSQAEYTTMALRSVPGTVVVGSTTAGADGNVSSFALPGGLRSMISGIGVFYPDGTPTQRVGIVPDHTVLPSIAGVKAGRDELLEYAMKLIER